MLDVITTNSEPTRKQFGVPPIIKLSACLRFFAKGGYQTGVRKDFDVFDVAKSTFSKVPTEVVNVLENHLFPVWIKVPHSAEENRKIARASYIKHKIPVAVGSIERTYIQIIAPSDNKHLFDNRKGKYSLNALLVSHSFC